jgi:polyferredoxin
MEITGKKKILKKSAKKIQQYRFFIQSTFAILCIWIGIEFYLFVNYLESGGHAQFFQRPSGVDGFLPISSLMSFYIFLTTGNIHQAHPAGLFIFLSIILMSIIFGKSFCSWMCPIGFISELIGDFGEKLFNRKLRLPKILDIPLRSIKYLLLAFLIYAVLFLMTDLAVKAFLDSPYNLVADLKMYYFFADISRFSIIVLSMLFILSIFIRNFWCRYLCPYGALLGIISLLSPHKIKREAKSCIDCGLCSKACPSMIRVDKVNTVYSDECNTCLNCVDACPVSNTLQLKNIFYKKKKISGRVVAIGVVSIFLLVTAVGMFSGNWQNSISKEEYLIHYKEMNSYGHPTGTAAIKKFNESHQQKIIGKGDDSSKVILRSEIK